MSDEPKLSSILRDEAREWHGTSETGAVLKEAANALEAKDAQIAILRDALEPLVEIEVDETKHGGYVAGEVSIRDVIKAKSALAATPETAANQLAELRFRVKRAEELSIADRATCEVACEQLVELRKEREQLAAWKQEAITVQSWWHKIDDFVRKQPDAPLGKNVADIALTWLQERGELRKDKARVDWLDASDGRGVNRLANEIPSRRGHVFVVISEARVGAPIACDHFYGPDVRTAIDSAISKTT